MAYETGTASSPTDLLTKLATFAAANGWTSTALSTGRALTKGNVSIGLNGASTSLDTRGFIGAANNLLAWNAQANNSGTSHVCDIGAGPYTAYHFYALQESSKDLLAAVVEISAGVFRHWIACDLIKAGTYTGGTYTDSVNWDDATTYTNSPDANDHRYIADTSHGSAGQHGQFWVDSDGGTNTWGFVAVQSSYTLRNGIGSLRTGGKFETMHSAAYQRWNLRTPLWPVELFVNRASSLRSPLGRVPAMRQVNMRNHTPGEIVTIGGADFQFWPVVQRTDSWGSGTNGIPSSGYYGYAYKRT